MTIQRHFKLALTAGHTIPLVINANQYDSGEQWLFTLYNDGVRYTPSSGAIVGIKADRLGIINTGTVDANGRVVINETRQMTAAVGKNIFELLIDDQTHGTANFVVLVEPRPGDNADLSESDYSLFEEAIQGTSAAAIAQGVSDWMDDNLTPTTPVVDQSLTVQGAAADAKKTGDEVSYLKSAIDAKTGLSDEFKIALEDLAYVLTYKLPNGEQYVNALHDAMYPTAELSYITAVYTQSGVVYEGASLDDLKSDLVVTAHYSDGTSRVITSGYTLSGDLSVGTDTITVTYSRKTTTFTVTVLAYWDVKWDYSMGSPLDYGFYRSSSTTGTAVMQSDGYLLTNGNSDADNFIRHTGWENNVAPTSGDLEVVFSIPTMPNLSMGFVMGVPAFQTSIWANVLYENHLHSTQNTGNATVINGVTVNANTEYTMRFKFTPTLIEVYWNGVMVYTFSGTRANTRANMMLNAQNSNMALLVKAIRFKDMSTPPAPPAEVTSISAVFDQVGGTVYETDSLDSLKDHLTVTANYADSTSAVVTNYTLSGTLSVGTSVITVSYGGKTATFNVTVTAWDVDWEYTDGAPTDFDFYINPNNGTYTMTDDGYKVQTGANTTDATCRPNTDFNATSGTIETVLRWTSVPPSSMGSTIGGVGWGISIFGGKIWFNYDALGNNTKAVEVMSVSINTDYTIRCEYTPTLAKVYVNDELMYTHTGTRTNTRSRYMVNLVNKGGISHYIKAMRCHADS